MKVSSVDKALRRDRWSLAKPVANLTTNYSNSNFSIVFLDGDNTLWSLERHQFDLLVFRDRVENWIKRKERQNFVIVGLFFLRGGGAFCLLSAGRQVQFSQFCLKLMSSWWSETDLTPFHRKEIFEELESTGELIDCCGQFVSNMTKQFPPTGQ